MTEVVVEAEGETVGEAKWAALRELERRYPKVDRDAVRFEVLSEGERGLLGVGYAPARVVAMVDAPEEPAPPPAPDPAESDDDVTYVRGFLERTAAAVGATCTVAIQDAETGIVATLGGDDLGLLIGRHGQTIDALQYLTNALLHRRGSDRRVVVDAAGYRARRESSLRTMAHRASEQAIASGSRVGLEPMTSVERKVVHEFLKDDPEVETTSEGTEPNRYVVVVPRRDV